MQPCAEGDMKRAGRWTAGGITPVFITLWGYIKATEIRAPARLA